MILIVDDDKNIRELVDIYLNDHFPTTTASDGSEALALFDKPNEIKLIVSDVKMKPMDGITFIKELEKTHPNIPVIFMTGYCDDSRIIQYKYLGKPFLEKDLLPIVKELYNKG